MTETRGEGLLNTMFEGWDPYTGPLLRRKNGAIVSDRKGTTTPYALFNLQPRGKLFIGAGTDVYEGMIVGEHNRPSDLDVNCTREKKLTNIRAAGRDENVILTPHISANSPQAQCDLYRLVCEISIDVVEGRIPEWLANPDVLDHLKHVD